MNFISTRNNSPASSLSDAIAAGLAPDGGLYVPEKLPVARNLEAGADLAAFLDDVSTLEGLHDAVVGLIDPANHGLLTFAQECGLLACTKLQALAISAAELQLNPVETKGVRH